MIGAQSLAELFQLLAGQFTAIFRGVDYVSVACIDPEYEIARSLGQSGEKNSKKGFFVPLQNDQINQALPAGARPYLGPCNAALQALVFPHVPRPLGSIAIAPLMLHGRVIGLLNQGSRSAEHFSPDAATDLLEHLAAVTAMCIDSALNRERLKRDGLTDALTGVANRRFFERRLREEISVWLRHHNPLACLLVDLDHFKQVNDRHGHPTGDRALRHVAAALNEGLRSSDVLARYGGEEFVLILPDTGLNQALDVAHRLRANVAALRVPGPDDLPLPLTVSIGLACLPSAQGNGIDEPSDWLVQQADTALYRAKEAGRNRVVVAESTPLTA
jgi:diguanylate cyclase (GGDEF)-like protein